MNKLHFKILDQIYWVTHFIQHYFTEHLPSAKQKVYITDE